MTMASSPDLLLAAVRAVHFAAAIVLFGQLVYVLAVAQDGEAPPQFLPLVAWSLVALVASALAWLAFEAISMSGLPVSESLSAQTLRIVLAQTLYGNVWLLRIAACVVLALLVPRLGRRSIQALAALLAALLLAALAAMGHGVGGRGAGRLIHFGADAVHLLAAGAWLGALLPLVLVLERERRSGGAEALRIAAAACRRFSLLGSVSVVLILASGITNATYMLPDPVALLVPGYGRTLAGKILLFIAIVALAAENRWRFTPGLLGPNGALSLRRLERNAVVECALGFTIVAVVGLLGITMPGSHG